MFKQKKLSFGARFGLTVASGFLGILLFFSVVATALIADVQIVTSQDGLSGIIRTMMSAPANVRPQAPANISGEGLRVAPRLNRMNQMVRFEEADPSEEDDAADAAGDVAADLTEQVIGLFYEAMGGMFGEDMEFTQEEFTQMVNESTVKDYIADKTAALITDYLNDEITTKFEVQEVVDLIHENSELIESITGQPIPDDIAETIGKAFDENEIIVKVEAEGLAGFMEMMGGGENTEGGDAIGGSNAVLDMLSTVKEGYAAVSTIASTQNIVIGIVVCLVLMAAIVLINNQQLGKGLRRAGYPLVIAGSAVVLNILAITQPELFTINAGAGETASAAGNMVLKLARHILTETATPNIVVFSTGAVLVIGGIVLGILLRPKKVVEEAPAEIAPAAE